MPNNPVIVWFRNDLRIAANRALTAAVATGRPVVCCFILDDDSPQPWPLGAASRWWLDKSLADLGQRLAKLGGALTLRRGPARVELAKLVAETRATAVYCSRAYEPWAVELERQLKAQFEKQEVSFKRYAGALLREPEDLRTKAGDVYKVYTPFWRALSENFAPAPPPPTPKAIKAFEPAPRSAALASLALHPNQPDWSGGFSATWTPGEKGAHARLNSFLKRALKSYATDRNLPDIDGTSRLSPHLHFGEITPAQCWLAAVRFAEEHGSADTGLQTFLKEIAWREFSYALLFHWPDLPEQPFRKEFSAFPWRDDEAAFKAWSKGMTGYPLVDAGMRELWHTGYMHNRVRMVVASFLIKHLLISWQRGAAWFWDTLVDADLANNSASWQWVAGSGADAAPYFRIFNPVTQGEKFDPDGRYVRRWVPELKALPDDMIHAPWLAPADVLKAARITLGTSYPHPIVDHAAARARALAALDRVKLAVKS